MNREELKIACEQHGDCNRVFVDIKGELFRFDDLVRTADNKLGGKILILKANPNSRMIVPDNTEHTVCETGPSVFDMSLKKGRGIKFTDEQVECYKDDSHIELDEAKLKEEWFFDSNFGFLTVTQTFDNVRMINLRSENNHWIRIPFNDLTQEQVEKLISR